MKKWFFLGFLALFLIQRPAGATIITETFSVNLGPVVIPCPQLDGCSGTGTFTLNIDPSNSHNSSIQSYLIRLSSDENLNALSKAKNGQTNFVLGSQDAQEVAIYFGVSPIFTIAQLLPGFFTGSTLVTGFFTNDLNGIIIPASSSDPFGILKSSGPISYDDCGRTASDGHCVILDNPSAVSQSSLDVFNNDVNSDRYDSTGNLVPVPVQAPVPNSLSLVGIGIAGLGLVRRRRKQRLLALQLVGRVSAA